MNDEEFEAAFNEIRKKFLEKLRQSPPEFELFASQIKQGNIDDAELDHIRMEMHKYAGSARTFGYSELSNYAAQAENYLNQIVSGTPLSDVSVELLNVFDLFLNEVQKV